MTKKDFQKIAEMVRFAHYLDGSQKKALAEDLASILKQINNNFDKSRFFDACEV